MLVAKLLTISITLMISAAVTSIFRVFAMRFGLFTSGITATPVSKPERPESQLRKNEQRQPDDHDIFPAEPPLTSSFARRAVFQLLSRSGCVNAS